MAPLETINLFNMFIIWILMIRNKSQIILIFD
jgi:hypothetical protein